MTTNQNSPGNRGNLRCISIGASCGSFRDALSAGVGGSYRGAPLSTAANESVRVWSRWWTPAGLHADSIEGDVSWQAEYLCVVANG
jgi:hypothetical protein